MNMTALDVARLVVAGRIGTACENARKILSTEPNAVSPARAAIRLLVQWDDAYKANPGSEAHLQLYDLAVSACREVVDSYGNGWHPIETAPRHGRRFLFWNGEHVGVAQFVMGRYFAPQGHPGGSIAPATHWMPLPEPPV